MNPKYDPKYGYILPHQNPGRTIDGQALHRKSSLRSNSMKQREPIENAHNVPQQYADQNQTNFVAKGHVQSSVAKSHRQSMHPSHIDTPPPAYERYAQKSNNPTPHQGSYQQNAPLNTFYRSASTQDHYAHCAGYYGNALPQVPEQNVYERVVGVNSSSGPNSAHHYCPEQNSFAKASQTFTPNAPIVMAIPCENVNVNHSLEAQSTQYTPIQGTNELHENPPVASQQNSLAKASQTFTPNAPIAMAVPCENVNVNRSLEAQSTQNTPIQGENELYENRTAASQTSVTSAPEESEINQTQSVQQPHSQLVAVKNKPVVISGLLALNALLTKFMNDIYAPIDPDDIVNNTMTVLGKHKHLFTHNGCAIVGTITTSLLNTRDAYMTACREVYEWTSLVAPLLKGFLRLVENGKNSSLTAKVALLDKVATQAIVKMNLVVTNLDACVHYLKQTLTNLQEMHEELRDLQNPTEPEYNWGAPESPPNVPNVKGDEEYSSPSKHASTHLSQSAQEKSAVKSGNSKYSMPTYSPEMQKHSDDRAKYHVGAAPTTATKFPQRHLSECLTMAISCGLSQHASQKNSVVDGMHIAAINDFTMQASRIESLDAHFSAGINEICDYVKTLSELGTSLKQSHQVNPLSGVSEVDLIPVVQDLMQACAAYNKK